MAQKGKVIFLNGTAISKDANGRDRLLKVGDVVFSGDTVTMGGIEGTKAIILMENGKEYILLAGDVVRLRGEPPVDESFDAAAVLKALLEQDSQRTEKVSEDYHNDKTTFTQSGKKAEISTNISEIRTNSGGESSAILSNSDNETIIKTGHYSELARSISDVNPNILEVFTYQAGEKNNIKTNSIASTTPIIKQSSQATTQPEKPAPNPVEPTPEPKPTPEPEPEPEPKPEPIPEPEPTPITPPPVVVPGFKATSLSFITTDANSEKFSLNLTKNPNTHISVATTGNGDQTVVLYIKNGSNDPKKIASFTYQDGTSQQETTLSGTDLSIGENKIVAFTSSANDDIDKANAQSIFANNASVARNTNATSVQELYYISTPPEASWDTTTSNYAFLVDLPNLSTNKGLSKITVRFKDTSDTSDTSHEIILTANDAQNSWDIYEINKITLSSGAKTKENTNIYTVANNKLSMPYDALAKDTNTVSATVTDVFDANSNAKEFDLSRNLIKTTIELYSDQSVQNGQIQPSAQTLINSNITTDSSLNIKVKASASLGGNEILIYKKLGNDAPTLVGKASLTEALAGKDINLNLTTFDKEYKLIAIAHDSTKAAPSEDFINSAFASTNKASTISSDISEITVISAPSTPEAHVDDKGKIYVSLLNQPFTNTIKIAYQKTDYKDQNDPTIQELTLEKTNGSWAIGQGANLPAGFSINSAENRLEIDYAHKDAKIDKNKPVRVWSINELGVNSDKYSAFASINNINKFIDADDNNTHIADTLISKNNNFISQDPTPSIKLGYENNRNSNNNEINDLLGDVVAIYAKDEKGGEVKLIDAIQVSDKANTIPLNGLEMGHNYKIIALPVPDVSNNSVDRFKNNDDFKALRSELLKSAQEYIETNRNGVKSLHMQLKQLIVEDARTTKINQSGNIEFDSTLDDGDIKVYIKEADGSLEPLNTTGLINNQSGLAEIKLTDYIKPSTSFISQNDKIGASDYGLKGYVYGLSNGNGNGNLFTNINGGKSQIEASLGSENNKFSIISNSSKLYFKSGGELSLDYFNNNATSEIGKMSDEKATKLKAQNGMFEFLGNDYNSLTNKNPDVIVIQQKGTVNLHIDALSKAPEYAYIHYPKNGESINVLKINDTRLEVYANNGTVVPRASDGSNNTLQNITHEKDETEGVVKFNIGKILSDGQKAKIEITSAIEKGALNTDKDLLDISIAFGDENGEKVALGEKADGIDMRAIFSTDYETQNGKNVAISDPVKYAKDHKLDSEVYYEGPESDGLLSSSNGKTGGLYAPEKATIGGISGSKENIIIGRENAQDDITGSTNSDYIDGRGGNGSTKPDDIKAGEGDDTIVYHQGDRIQGGTGDDTLILLPESYSNIPNISGVEKISLGDYEEGGINNGGEYTLNLRDILSAPDSGKDKVIIEGDQNDTLTINKDTLNVTSVDKNGAQTTSPTAQDGYYHYKIEDNSKNLYLDINENITFSHTI